MRNGGNSIARPTVAECGAWDLVQVDAAVPPHQLDRPVGRTGVHRQDLELNPALSEDRIQHGSKAASGVLGQ